MGDLRCFGNFLIPFTTLEIAMSRKKQRQNVPPIFTPTPKPKPSFSNQAQAYFRDDQKVANNAPDGNVPDQTESAASRPMACLCAVP